MEDGAGRVFAALAGQWSLTRQIEPGIGSAAGSAVFAQVTPDRLHYREDVQLRLANGHTGAAYREYDYVLEPGRIRVLLADGTTMHLLQFQETGRATTGDDESPSPPVWSAADVHDCRADQYRGTYRMDEHGALTVDMRVTGPHKDYWMLTRYARA